MTDIVGGADVEGAVYGAAEGAVRAHAPEQLAASAEMGFAPGSSGSKILDAVVACAARWGIEKTTVDDVAREAGVSRATVYRLFPGGKPSMVEMATNREAVVLLGEAMERISAGDTLEDAVVEMIRGGYEVLSSQAVLTYMRTNEPTKLRTFFSFERMDALLRIAGEVVSPSLEEFLDPDQARTVVVWVTRLVVSHFVNPDPVVDLLEPATARHMATTFILPGIALSSPATEIDPHQPEPTPGALT